MVIKIPSHSHLWLYLRLVGWWQVMSSGLLLGVFYVLDIIMAPHTGNIDLINPRRVVETVTPLAFALQAAFLLGPDNEPALELLLSYPKSLPRLFWERLRLIGGMHAALALIATIAFTATWHAEGFGLALTRWLASGIALGGIAVFTTQLTRQGVFGTLVTISLWVASLYGGDKLLTVWPWFWPFCVYLQPGTTSGYNYLLNRLLFMTLGIGLTLIAIRLVSDSDRLLGNR